jgi:hypothetical protein
MCLQTALTIASVGLKLAEGAQAARAAKIEAAVNEQRARLARQTAAANAERPLAEGRLRIGRYLARSGQTGVDLARGSPVDVVAAIAADAHRGHLTALHGGDVAAWEHGVAAAGARTRGRNAMRSAVADGALTLLGQAATENWFGNTRQKRGGFTVPY